MKILITIGIVFFLIGGLALIITLIWVGFVPDREDKKLKEEIGEGFYNLYHDS